MIELLYISVLIPFGVFCGLWLIRDNIRTQRRSSTMATTVPVQQLFTYDHLPEHLQEVCRPFSDLALEIADFPRQSDARDAALWKLWEAKNLAVVAVAQDV